MTPGKDRSLGELEAGYKEKIKELTDQRVAIAKQLEELDRKLKAYGEKLHWVRTLIVAPDSTDQLPRTKRKRGPRRSPVREAVYQVLSDRRGQWFTARQIGTLIRKDTSKRPSRQSVNVNLNLLEKTGRVQRRPAPRGSGGAQFVFSAK